MWDTGLWITIFIALFAGGWKLLTSSGKTMHLRPKYFIPTPKPKQQAVLHVKTLAQVHAEDHANWQEAYNLLVRATCVHSYPATGHKASYAICGNCGYEEPWEWCEGCTCVTQSSIRLTDAVGRNILLHRSGTCIWHGIDWGNFGKYSDRSNKPFSSKH